MDTQISFLGTGGAFDWEYGNSAALVKLGQRNILLDCGPLVYPRLASTNQINDIDVILLTHLHGDHVGGLFQLIMHRAFKSVPSRRTKIAYPTPAFRDEIWTLLKVMLTTPEQFVDFEDLQAIRGAHYIDTSNRHIPGLLSYAYYFEEGRKLLYYSGDLGDVDITSDFIKTYSRRRPILFHEISHTRVFGHTYYKELMAITAGYECYGYHCDPRMMPPDNTIPLVANCPKFLAPK